MNPSLLRAVRKNLSEIWVGIVLIAAQIFLFRYWTRFGHSTVTQSNGVSNFAFVISNGNSLCVFEIFKIDVRSSEVLQSWNKNIWAAMAWCPLGISKEKTLSLLRLKGFDLQNRPKTFQLLAEFAIKIPERSTPYFGCWTQNPFTPQIGLGEEGMFANTAVRAWYLPCSRSKAHWS